MPRTADPAKQLSMIIARLQEERQAHANRVAQIDAIFERLGIQLREPKRRGRPPGRPGRKTGRPAAAATQAKAARRGRRRKRGVFEKTANQSVLDFVRSKGKQGATTAEINKHWESEGRRGTAYVTIGKLVTNKELRREDLKGKRGSRYRVG